MLKFQAFDKYKAVVCEIYCLHGEVVRIYSWKYAKVEQIFDEYKDAQEYWDAYADVETCEAGELLDLDDGEVIWEFGEEF